MIQYITNDNYEDFISNNKLVIIDFYADWCSPCKMYSPIFESVSSNYKEIKFVKCNIDEGKRVAVRFGVRSIPTTIIIKDKEVTSSMSGFMTEEQLKNFVSSNIKEGE